MENELHGVVVPAITPFDQVGEIDEEALREYLDFLAGKVQGISVGAIYGSGMLMRLEQRKRVVEIAIQSVQGRVPVSAFVGALDTDSAVELARHAEKVGAKAVSCVQPIYYRHTDEAIFRHFEALVEAVDIPVYVYDSPVYAGNEVSLPVLQRLAEAGLAGVITGAATYGIEHLWNVLRNVKGPGFEVWSIRDGLAMPALLLGASGFESGVANFFPELVFDLYQSIKDQNIEMAVALQNRAHKLRDISHQLGRNIPTLHALIAMRGLETGFPKRPFFLLGEEEISWLKSELKKLDFSLPLNLENMK